MQILLGLILGAVVGLAVHAAWPNRSARGAALAPFAGAAASGVVWTALTWMGHDVTSPLLWILAVVAPAATTLLLVPVVTRVRVQRDAADRARLGV